MKPPVLKNLVFDWKMCFRLCKVYRFKEFRWIGVETHPERSYDVKFFNNMLLQAP